MVGEHAGSFSVTPPMAILHSPCGAVSDSYFTPLQSTAWWAWIPIRSSGIAFMDPRA